MHPPFEPVRALHANDIGKHALLVINLASLDAKVDILQCLMKIEKDGDRNGHTTAYSHVVIEIVCW